MIATKVPPRTDEGPNALDSLTEIALLKESGSASDLDRAAALFEELLSANEKYFRGLAGKLMPFDGSTVSFDIDDLYSELVFSIWKNADDFAPKDTGSFAVRKQFVGWGSAILRNIVRDKLKALQLAITTEEANSLGWTQLEDHHPEPSPRAKVLAEILEKMDPIDAEIVRWSGLAMPLDGTQMRTDAAERAEICRSLNITEAGLRKRRERAFKVLREEIESRFS